MRKLGFVLVVSTCALGCSASEPLPAAPEASASAANGEEQASITIAVYPTELEQGRAISVTLSRAIPNKPGKRFRISLSTLGAKTFSGPSQFLEPGTIELELRPVEPGTFEVRLLESDGPQCRDGSTEGGPCAENEHVIATSETISVSPRPRQLYW